MSHCNFLIIILFPILAGLILLVLGHRCRKQLCWISFAITVLTSIGCLFVLFSSNTEEQVLLTVSQNVSMVLKPDGLGKFFLGIIAALWPLSALYSCSYMEQERHLPMFYGFFLIAFGVTIGIAMAGNLFTMYLFYEFLTLSTIPLVIQPFTREAIHAAKEYVVYSLGGAALGFVCMVYLFSCGAGDRFTLGGTVQTFLYGKNIHCLMYLIGFLGFGVKAAVFPLYRWLPRVSVAATPVTALLHAVAVVKAGAFAVMRLTYFCFGTEALSGSWGQYTAMMLAAFTIVFGATMAVKETHFKRRMVYSTVANLSYILFAVTLMTPHGLSAALLHMAAHACIKILAFFCVGSVLHHTGRTSIYDLDGFGRKMPVTFGCFTLAACSLVGVPPLNGFVSKWHILSAACQQGSGFAFVGAGLLLFAALLTAIYMFTTVRRAWFPEKGLDTNTLLDVHEADWKMLIPMCLLALGIILCGIFAEPIVNATFEIAGGIGL